jgi:cytidylate kinase
VKIYLDADLDTRARRRHAELVRGGIAIGLDEVRAELDRRDARDRTRSDSPLRVAEGAVVVDTSGLDVPGQTERVLEVVRRHPAFPGATTPGRKPGGGV